MLLQAILDKAFDGRTWEAVRRDMKVDTTLAAGVAPTWTTVRVGTIIYHLADEKVFICTNKTSGTWVDITAEE